MDLPAADLESLRRAGDVLVGLGDAIGVDDWERPTPCTEWTVGDLVDHVVGGNVFTLEILSGASADDAMATVMATFEGGYDRVARLGETTREQAGAFAAAGALEGRYHHVEGDLAGVDVLRARTHDLIVHGWDLAQAVDPPATIDAELVAWAADELARGDSLTAQHFGIARESVVDSSTLLAAFGRTADPEG